MTTEKAAEPVAPRHSIQPLYEDEHGVLRFKKNHIVEFLLDAGPNDMNSLARLPFSQEDREQFAQLIGYSLSGFGELSYVTTETYMAAQTAYEDPETQAMLARVEYLENSLAELRKLFAPAAALLFEQHVDDFNTSGRWLP